MPEMKTSAKKPRDPEDQTQFCENFRRGAGRQAFALMQQAVCKKPFDVQWAQRAWAACEALFLGMGGSGESWHADPWRARALGCDTGQADNEHSDLNALRHPLIAACRFGSAQSIAWLCSKTDIDPVVPYKDVCDCWCFSRAASSGISGAFEPLWNKARSNGWTRRRLGEALSSWLIGVQAGPAEAMEPSLMAARPALDELLRDDPLFKMPLAPASTFGSALSAALASDGPYRGNGLESCQALISFAPADVWQHEALMPESEIYEAILENPRYARTFAETALSLGNVQGLVQLMAAGHACPSPQRAWEVLREAPSTDDHWRAYNIAQQQAALKELEELELSAPLRPDGGIRNSCAL
jgi:hypothetical protein